MSAWYAIKKYLRYRLRAGNEHSIHSPFVFKLYTEVISNKSKFYAYDELNKIRRKLLTNSQTIEVTDLGAGSQKLGNTRKISDIAKYSVINEKYGELLFRLTEYFKPQNILELGTSLGLSTLYLVKAAPNAKILTVEGCPNTFRFARSLFEQHETRNIQTNNSSFDSVFNEGLEDKAFDMVYIDGNHTYEATIKYFNELLKYTNKNSILIFDDIYWSEGMTKAWEEIKQHSAVTLSIDLYKIGLIFFRKENKQKEHFVLRY